jgi:predicted molibdopterin-dependent oxidoreductase YjgC/uncharacterized protein YlaI
VELIQGTRSRLVTACNFPIEAEGMEVRTGSPRVRRARRWVLELLLARAPEAEVLQRYAREYGLERSRFPRETTDDCILCGLCVQVCNELIGANAISFVGRGVKRGVETAFRAASEECIGCGACAVVCPTGAITVEDVEEVRRLPRWHTTVELARCPACGERFAPSRQLSALTTKDVPIEDWLYLCPRCRRRLLGKNLTRAKGGKVKL